MHKIQFPTLIFLIKVNNTKNKLLFNKNCVFFNVLAHLQSVLHLQLLILKLKKFPASDKSMVKISTLRVFRQYRSFLTQPVCFLFELAQVIQMTPALYDVFRNGVRFYCLKRQCTALFHQCLLY